MDHADHAGPSGPQDNGWDGISCGPRRRPSSALSELKHWQAHQIGQELAETTEKCAKDYLKCWSMFTHE